MNDNDFEEELRALSARLVRPDPTPGWKAEILERARHAREQAVPRTPRWLLAALGIAWLMIAVLRLTTPGDSTAYGPAHSATMPVAQNSPAPEAPWSALMAFHSNPELLDLP
jgi:hypothetical protein